MKKYIECEAAYRFAQDQLKKETGAYTKGWNNALSVMKGALHNNDAIPAADVVPVVRAKWENRFNFYLKCSNCFEPYAVSDVCGCKQARNFCPHCGAKMEKEGDGE